MFHINIDYHRNTIFLHKKNYVENIFFSKHFSKYFSSIFFSKVNVLFSIKKVKFFLVTLFKVDLGEANNLS